jgi:CRISPR/Cas system-associated exonuclease Cas4 (RecB family)
MKIPQIPTVKAIPHFTPSLYEAALHCKARAIWSVFGDRYALPQSSNAILGSCFHKVLELANKGQFPQEKKACYDAAQQVFEEQVQLQYLNAHSLLKSKFRSIDRLPYYYLSRERAALQAVDISLKKQLSTSKEILKPSGGTEVSLVSRDGLIKGRPDYINAAKSEIIDYKSGTKAEASGTELSVSEIRQLRLYAHLCLENDIQISKGVIVRGNNQHATLTISVADAQQEGHSARVLLAELNAATTHQTFQEMANPSPEKCKGCSCIPLCEAFWEQATPEWASECGLHLEAEIIKTPITLTNSASKVITLETNAIRGTFSPAKVTIQKIPETWLTLDGENIPKVGNVIRLIDGDGKITSSDDLSVVGVNKFSTSIWIVEKYVTT